MTDTEKSEIEQWQLEEIRKGLDDLDHGRTVPHAEVSKWLRSWGTPPFRVIDVDDDTGSAHGQRPGRRRC